MEARPDKDSESASASAKGSADSASLTIELERENVNLIGAAVEGASEGMKLAINVAAMLIAFLALIALVDTLLATVCESIGWVSANGTPAISLGVILGYLGWPIAWLLGIPADECLVAGRLIGLKTVANEFVAYQQLGEMMKSEAPPISARTGHVLTYALAGFSNFAAIGIQVGGVGGLAPKRKTELAQLGLRAMFGGLLACCMTGAIASLMM
ncbi:MAG: nucleoside transporter C-terminal domain-containing protein [Rhodopirellula sp. JB053]